MIVPPYYAPNCAIARAAPQRDWSITPVPLGIREKKSFDPRVFQPRAVRVWARDWTALSAGLRQFFAARRA
jgi:hypothetical protein